MYKVKRTIRYEGTKNKGITLISLVITIIVLLILSGVSIAMLTGENGILTQAKRAKEETENAARQEEKDLAELEAVVNGEDIVIIPVDDKNPGELEQENETTFVINSIEDLVVFSYNVRNGNKYENQTVKLGTNLDFKSDKSYVDPDRTDYGVYGYNGNLKELLTTGEGFIPIGQQQLEETNNFYGTFDGNNNAICSLYENIKSDKMITVGLFSINHGIIQNTEIIDANVIVEGSEGSTTTVAGGLVGINYNNLYNNFVSGDISCTGKSWTIAGGICGLIYEGGDITNSCNLATIKCENKKEVDGAANAVCGGIVGQVEGEKASIEKCFNKGNIICDGGNTQITVGGIIGSMTSKGNNCEITNCYNAGKTQGNSASGSIKHIGGVIGLLKSSSLSNCYNIGEVVGIKEGNIIGDNFRIGGIVGTQSNNSQIDNVYNIKNVVVKNGSQDIRVGGIIGGTIKKDVNDVNANNGYNIGKINAPEIKIEQLGGVAGSNLLSFNNCYYLESSCNVGVAGSETFIGVTKLKNISEFPTVLEVVNGENAFMEDINNINGGYPILKMEN